MGNNTFFSRPVSVSTHCRPSSAIIHALLILHLGPKLAKPSVVVQHGAITAPSRSTPRLVACSLTLELLLNLPAIVKEDPVWYVMLFHHLPGPLNRTAGTVIFREADC